MVSPVGPNTIGASSDSEGEESVSSEAMQRAIAASLRAIDNEDATQRAIVASLLESGSSSSNSPNESRTIENLQRRITRLEQDVAYEQSLRIDGFKKREAENQRLQEQMAIQMNALANLQERATMNDETMRRLAKELKISFEKLKTAFQSVKTAQKIAANRSSHFTNSN